LRPYLTLRERIDRFYDSVEARYGDQIACRPGCAECCQGGLTVQIIEAMAMGRELGIDDERIALQAGQLPLRAGGRCAFLDDNDHCRVYPQRPLTCRTHGLSLEMGGQEPALSCDKNFVSQVPHHTSVLDVEAMQTTLFAVNLDFCQRRGFNPMARVALDRLHELVDWSWRHDAAQARTP
jgi:hypothetical protein